MKKYTAEMSNLISYPLGGIGAGMICLQGPGNLGNISIWHKPNLNNQPIIFSAITILGKENISKVIEAPVPLHNFFSNLPNAGNGINGQNYGLPRFSSGEFSSNFPFAKIKLTDNTLPVSVEITGWSPFIPNDEDNSSLPFAALEYTITNVTSHLVEAVYYFNSYNFMKMDEQAEIQVIKNGFILHQPGTQESPHHEGSFCVSVSEDAYIDAAWFRGRWFDTLTMLWNSISKGIIKNSKHPESEKNPGNGASLIIPVHLNPKEQKTIKLRFSWFIPDSDIRTGKDGESFCFNNNCENTSKSELSTYKPWYTTVIKNIEDANQMWSDNYDTLYKETQRFTDCFYDSTLPEEIMDAVSANLSILKSPTLLRQTDGRVWGWEGCSDCVGCCDGSCTHVWNYAQSLCHLFPKMERTLRQSEFYDAQDPVTGHQEFRIYLPIRKSKHTFYAASDGQLGGIIKVYRDWRISGDLKWLHDIWPQVKQSLDYCINQWDPGHEGIIKQPHHNTYDIEFWGPNGMSMSYYLGALKSASEMSVALGYTCPEYLDLYKKGRLYIEQNLFNGDYFYQKVMWKEVSPEIDVSEANNETKSLLEREGPKYQYGNGCLSDSVVGIWLSEFSGLHDLVDEEKLIQNLRSVYKFNFKRDLSSHANTQRPGYAAWNESGLLLCTWPKGGKPSLPFVYSDEVWTGIEYQVAAHLISKGFLAEGLDIVNACRKRYDGTLRNPFDEYECGHWYARAMSSYSLLQAYTGVRFDAVTKTLYLCENNSRNYRTFLSTATGYGTVEVNDSEVKITSVAGVIDAMNIVITP